MSPAGKHWCGIKNRGGSRTTLLFGFPPRPKARAGKATDCPEPIRSDSGGL